MNAREFRYKRWVAGTLLRTGMVAPMRPDRAVRTFLTLRRWGPNSASAYAISAIRYPRRTALIDERGSLTFEEVHRRTNALARALGKRR